MSSSEGPPEYELATSPLQMLAGVVITLSAHLEASAQLLPRKLAPIAGSARQSRATTNDDDDRDGPDAGPDGIGPD